MSNISTSFGFNQGIKSDYFGFVDSNTTPAPPVAPQPKYMTMFFVTEVGGGLIDVQTLVNTTNATWNDANADPVTSIITISFNGSLASNVDNIYVEGYWTQQWWDVTNDTNPLFQVYVVDTGKIEIRPVNWNTHYNLVAGRMCLSLIVFE